MCGHAHPWTFQNEKHKEAIENSYQAVTHKMLMKLKYWRNKNDGLNSLQYSMRFIEKKPLYTHLMIESRLLVPKTIKMEQQKQNLIDISKLPAILTLIDLFFYQKITIFKRLR